MNRPSILRAAAFAAALAVVVASVPAVLGATHYAAAPTSVAVERRAHAADSPPVADLYQSVLSFEPGAWTALHSHTGGSYNTVVQGTVTLRIGDAEQTFGPGEGWADEPGVLHVAGNAGQSEARLIASMVVQPGLPPATIATSDDDEADGPPPPEALAMTKALAALPAGPLDVVEQVAALEPGARIAPQDAPGPRMFGVMEGSVTVEIDGRAHVVEAGRGWSEPAGGAYVYTAGDAGAQLAMTALVPRGAAVAAAGGRR